MWQVTKRMLKTLENTRFSGSPIVAVAANPGAAENVSLLNPALPVFSIRYYMSPVCHDIVYIM